VVTVSDTSGPVITLTGPASVTVECAGTYVEQGATATDVCEGDSEVHIVNSSVNPAVVGVYTVTYSAADSVNNASQATRRVTVADTAAPVITLTGSGGYLSGDVESLFNWNSRVWSIGPGISLPIFAGGRNRANLQRAWNAYYESVALYRQQVLVAFGDVENSLSGIRHLRRLAR